MLSAKSIENKRIEKIKSLNPDELNKYMDSLVKEATFINKKRLKDNFPENELKSTLNKIDELIALRKRDTNIEVVINKNLFQAEISSHIDTLVGMYKERVFEVVKTVLILLSDLKTEYITLNFNIMLLYDLCFHKNMLLTASAITNFEDEDKSDMMVNSIFKAYNSNIKYFKYIMPELVKQTKFTIETIEDYLNEMPDLTFLDKVKEDCINFDKSTDTTYLKDTDFNKNRLKTIDYILTLYELKNKSDEIINPLKELLKSDNVFYQYSEDSYKTYFENQDKNSEDYVSFKEFLKTEIKYNLKDFELYI